MLLQVDTKQKVEHLLSLFPEQVHSTNTENNQPLHLAIWFGNTDVTRLLIAAGADVNFLGNLKRTPVHFAAERGHPDIIKVL